MSILTNDSYCSVSVSNIIINKLIIAVYYLCKCFRKTP